MSNAKKYVLAVLLLGGIVGSAFAGTTRFSDLQVRNLTTTGVYTTSASTPYAVAVASVTAAVPASAPTQAGLIAFSTSYVMYVSTGTGTGAWVKIGAQ